MNLMDIVKSRIQAAASNIQKASNNPFLNPAGVIGNAIAKGQSFNPSANGGNNFWSSAPAQTLGKVQNFIQSPAPVNIVPHIQPFKGTNLSSNIGNELANLPGGIVNSVVGQGVIAPALDLGNIYGRALSGQQLPQYGELKSGATKLGYQAASVFNPDSANSLGTKYGFKQVAGNAAAALTPAMNAFAPEGGVNIANNLAKKTFKTAVIEGAKGAGILGAGMGLLQGLADNKEIENNLKYLENIGLSTVTGGAIGAVLGGAIGGGSSLIGNVFSKVKSLNPELSDKEVVQKTTKFLKDGIWRNKSNGQFAPKEPIFYGDLREQLGLPRTGIEKLGSNRGGFADLNAEVFGGPKSTKADISQLDTLTGMKSQEPILTPGLSANPKLEPVPQTNQTVSQPRQLDQPLEKIIQQGRDQIGSQVESPKTPTKQAIKQTFDNLYTQWVDRYNPIINAANTAKKQLKAQGAELLPKNDPTYLVRRLTGAGGIADTTFRTELNPIIKQVETAGIPKLDMDTYLANKRMAGFGAAGRDIIGADPVKSQEIVSAMEQKYGSQISQIADQLYAFQDKGFQKMVDAGFISPEAAATIRSQNPDYAPLNRVMDQMDEYLGLPTKKTMQGSQPIQKIKGSNRKIDSPMENIIGNLFKQTAAVEKNAVAKSIVGLQEIAPELGFNKVGQSGADTITVWNNGQKEFWQVGKDIADVAKGVNEEAMNLVLKIIQTPASILRQGATGRNPEFMFPNIIKDQLDAGITSKYGYIPFVDYVSGFKSMITNDAIFQKWESSGAKIDLGEISGRKSITQLFDEKKASKNVLDWIGAGLDFMGKYSEQPTRVGLFKKAYKATGNELMAMMESRDATLDFARMGSKMKVANSIVPFLNVGVQGFDKLIRSIKNDPAKLAVNMGIYAAAPAIATTLYNLTQHPNEYKEIPQYVKDNNFVFVIGRNDQGTVDYRTIPKGNVLPVVANPIQSFLEYAHGQDNQSFAQMALSLLSSTLPVVGDGSSVKEIAIKTIGQNLPQAVKPITENLLNKSFYKYDPNKEQTKEIVPSYLQKKPAYLQKYDFTPVMYQKIGAAFNVSPLQVQNLMEGYLAGYTKIPAQIVDSLVSISKGEPVQANDKTILRRFIQTTYPNSGAAPEPSFKPQVPGIMDRLFPNKVSAAETSPAVDQSSLTPQQLQQQQYELGDAKDKNKNTGVEQTVGPYKVFTDAFGTQHTVDTRKTNYDLYKAKLEVEASGDTKTIGDSFVYRDENGNPQVIQKTFSAQLPQTTGIDVLDKNAVSSYKSALTSRIKDVGVLLSKGAITQQQAMDEIDKITKVQNVVKAATAKPKKGKLITLPKSSAKLKVKVPKLPSLRSKLSTGKMRSKYYKFISKI